MSGRSFYMPELGFTLSEVTECRQNTALRSAGSFWNSYDLSKNKRMAAKLTRIVNEKQFAGACIV